MNEVSHYTARQIHPQKNEAQRGYDTLSIMNRTNAHTSCFVVSGHAASVSLKKCDTYLLTVTCRDVCYWRLGSKRNLFSKKKYL
jgi:hypothetical protein